MVFFCILFQEIAKKMQLLKIKSKIIVYLLPKQTHFCYDTRDTNQKLYVVQRRSGH